MSFMREHEIGFSPQNRESNNQEMRQREGGEEERDCDKVEHESRLRLFLCLTFSFHQVSLGIGARFQLLQQPNCREKGSSAIPHTLPVSCYFYLQLLHSYPQGRRCENLNDFQPSNEAIFVYETCT